MRSKKVFANGASIGARRYGFLLLFRKNEEICRGMNRKEWFIVNCQLLAKANT